MFFQAEDGIRDIGVTGVQTCALPIYELGAKLKNAVVANGFVGLLLTAAMVLLYFNLHRIGQPEELLPLIRPYFLVNLGSLLFVGLFNTLKQLFDGKIGRASCRERV